MLSFEVIAHVACMSFLTLIIVPIASCIPTSHIAHRIVYSIGIIIMTIGITINIREPFTYDAGVHVTLGFLLYMLILGATLFGSSASVRAANTKSMMSRHVQWSTLLLHVGLPFQAFTGIVTILHLSDAGALECVATSLVTCTCIVTAFGYAHMSRWIGIKTTPLVLFRSYMLFSGENVIVMLLGIAGILYSLYFEAGLNLREAIVHIATSTFVSTLGLAALLSIRTRASTDRLIPRFIVHGLPVCVVFVILIVVSAIWPVRNDQYNRIASTLISASLGLALVARATRLIQLMPGCLCIVGTLVFFSQAGIEQFYTASFKNALLAWFVCPVAIGVALGLAMYAWSTGVVQIEERPKKVRVRKPDGLNDEIDAFVAEEI